MPYIAKNGRKYGGKLLMSPECYSTEEKEIGCWTDGKPLYQKTLIYQNISTGRVDNLAHNIANIDTVFVVDWAIYNSNGTTVCGFETSNLAYWANIFLVDRTGIYYRFGSDWGTGYNLGITLQYTKTTDTAGAGTWTPSGVPAIHYSTNEHIIGTWIDGKSLYERILQSTETSNIIVNSNSTGSSVTGITNIYLTDILPSLDQIVNIELMQNLDGTSSNYQKFWFNFHEDDGKFYQIDNPGVQFISYRIGPRAIFKFQYTKN